MRALCRTLLVALAIVQAWLFRHEISPDGVAYLDLSDSVVRGQLGELVNGYWSPLYPILIGAVRVALSRTPLGEPRWEFMILHVANLISFALALAAYEWFLGSLDSVAAKWGRSVRSAASRTAAYGLFAIAMLDMISLKGTVPDLLLAAAIFGAFACMLRLALNPRDRRSALFLGVMLAAGALTKSFLFPLAAVVLLTAGVASWRRDRTGIAIAAGAFVVLVAPWVIAVSQSVGRFSTGETGSLNYAWYVNGQQPHNTGVMPRLAAPAEPLPLDGLAILPDARGTNPLWYDPARWNRDIRPRFSLRQQWPKLWLSAQYYAYVLAPFIAMLAAVGAAMRWQDVRATLTRSWVILLPCLAAFAAYSVVYTTSRYIAAFLVAACGAIAAALPREMTMSLRRFFLGGVVALVILGSIAPFRGRILLAAGALLATGIWAAVWRSRGNVVAPHRMLRVLAFAVLTAAALPAALQGLAAVRNRGGDPHPDWTTAQQLIAQGIAPGSRIAFLGNPENSGWARLARYQIVAVVPTSRVEAFKKLSDADRAQIVRVFQRAGAIQLLELSSQPAAP